MNWNIVAERTKLFAFVWGTLFCGAVLPAVFGMHGGYRNAEEAVLTVIVVEMMSCCFGVLPALLYAVLLGFYERDKAEQNKSLLVPLLICAVYEMPIFAWLARESGAAYSPDGWFNGGFRIGTAGYIAALVAGYFVARQPVDKWAKCSKASAVVYVIGAIVAFWLISALLFPTFQAVKASTVSIMR